LNYSSDIDLIVLFDAERARYQGRRTAQDCFVKITQEITRILQQRTGDGYVFRVDLRLRPDPRAMPLAISVEAAETYYQTIGQNWERSAMIKARPAAGDLELGEQFLENLRPFVWRRSLDFAAIEDIHAMKSMVHEHHRHGDMSLANMDVKLGPGGIREIEFFAQIQQLISGGREAGLRPPATLDALTALANHGRITDDVRDEMKKAYVFLRTIEHRLQMVKDEQTHTTPEDGPAMDNLVHFMAYDSREELERDLLAALNTVRKNYKTLVQDFDDSGKGGTFFSEAAPKLLEDMGYKTPQGSADILHSWQTGRYRALRTDRAQRLMRAIVEDLLTALAKTSNPDEALARFDRFISQLPAGVQLFSLFQANRWLFELISKIMGASPLLADHLARKPALLDRVLDPDFFTALPDKKTMARQLNTQLAKARDYQDLLDAARIWVNDMRFQAGVHILEGIGDVKSHGLALSDLADATVETLLPHVRSDFEAKYGTFKGGQLAVIAMGSYGGRALSFTSDLDMVLLYDVADMTARSTGGRDMSPSKYFSRLGQQFITALTTRTSEGVLYEVDMRLRPSGSQGPIVVTLATFGDYQSTSAWTWEHMALTRARIAVADDGFRAKIQASIQKALAIPRDGRKLLLDVADMRHKLNDSFKTTNTWSLRDVRGGLVDVEYITQYLLLRHPKLITADIKASLMALAESGEIKADDASLLAKAHKLYLAVQGVLRLCFPHDPIEGDFPDELKDRLKVVANAKSFTAAREKLEEAQANVYALYESIIEHPFEKL
ncbi:MAG: bifunctional [glutamine synthetase] adenylyltransferase/[glutamine synthetase]-adenylyl-L-tyrosine phosphorylase, partial [Sphingomonadales bacterium]|nr:bifunctional [glutamine synthetase] adenylyltransferase/[glutamine synthetase]-adenylyl-L-tyrosine phosphorylase [Sphingomonadales bacterium]